MYGETDEFDVGGIGRDLGRPRICKIPAGGSCHRHGGKFPASADRRHNGRGQEGNLALLDEAERRMKLGHVFIKRLAE